MIFDFWFFDDSSNLKKGKCQEIHGVSEVKNPNDRYS